jgi:spore protease
MKYQIKTDLIDFYIKNNKKQEEKTKNIFVNSYKINNINAAKIGKKKGIYKIINFKNYNTKITNILYEELTKLHKLKKNDSVLIVGLGNSDITPDSLGPEVCKKINIYQYRNVYSLIPGVMAYTGIETSNIVSAVVNQLKPSLVIVIDALACESIKRINQTIQLTNTGIHPGSGVGNKRKEISSDTLKTPVIAIGIPTVIDLGNIIYDSMKIFFENYCNILKDNNILLNENDKNKILGIIGDLDNYEIDAVLDNNMMVTTKDIDLKINEGAQIIANAINKFLK